MLFATSSALAAPASPQAGDRQSPARNMFANAEAYERFMGRWSRLLTAPLIEFAQPPARGHVLDVGSGTGALAFALAATSRELRITGIDPSTEYVRYAQSQNPATDRLAFETGDAQNLSSFPAAAFDGALSLLVFNFIPDPRRALSELRRVTKPGARISAAVWDYGDGIRMLRLFWDAAVAVAPAVAEKMDERHMPLCRSGELAALWRANGLAQVEERPLTITTQFASFPDYWDPFLLGQGPAGAFVAKLNPEQQRGLRAELERRVSAAAPRFALPARAWAVRGVVPAKA